MKKRLLWVLGLAGVLLLVLIGTGLHKPIIRKVHFGLLRTGILTPREIKLESFRPVPLGVETADSLRLLTEDGKVISLASFRGKTVFINKWATWCAPCIAEMPGIHKVFEDASDSVHFVMVSFDTDFEKAKAFKEKKGYSFPIYLISGFEPEFLKTPSIPATFIIEPDMERMHRYVGMRDYDTPEFREFLAESSR